MRLTSDFWIAALMRDVRRQGGFAYLARRGAEEAGAIFIRQNRGGGLSTLYGPAPQIFYDAAIMRGDRLFMLLLQGEGEIIDARLQQELDFDPDIWLVEIENFADLAETGLLQLAAFDM
ncbi:DUF1491 family protein [Candidatus Tokpelaia sp.]|uniref:DUF1491 family protein n=1 Tax=Candidatus Tokpelaia sp. TaxID=2233777 RepID=UPI00123B35CA|nr:DUF1491 family protein [Candidatus Tokpelaia sp.]KAA6406246.1 DUF1491 domain-containing protein [Candidatus Tokpelaia sp.]